MWTKLLCALIAAQVGTAALAQEKSANYPTRPIRVLDGFAAGGGSDFVARVMGQKLTESLGQAIIVDNRPGAGANLAAEIVAEAISQHVCHLADEPFWSIEILRQRQKACCCRTRSWYLR